MTSSISVQTAKGTLTVFSSKKIVKMMVNLKRQITFCNGKFMTALSSVEEVVIFHRGKIEASRE